VTACVVADRPQRREHPDVGDAAGDLITERLLRVIDEGRRTATYKLALLLALLECAALDPAATEVPTRTIASRVLSIYYPQTRAFVATGGIAQELRQISMKSSPVLRAALRLRLHGDGAGCRTADECARVLPEYHDDAVRAVEDTFVRYPIPLLQVVGAQVIPFLYEQRWTEGTSVEHLRRTGDDHIRLLPGIADRLVVLGPLLRPLIELHWTRDVARWSRVATQDEDLRRHLFGTERTAFPRRLRSGLAEIQNGACLYCGAPLAPASHVDHFLAWSRWPNDALENLVLTDPECNARKSDHLAAGPHLEAWARRSRLAADDLAGLAGECGWESDPHRSRALVGSAYGHLAAGTPLWLHGRVFVTATGPLPLPAP
jgi:5-methylcytosine-specific restriction endonuclease McrA